MVGRRNVDDAFAAWAKARRELGQAQARLAVFDGGDEQRRALQAAVDHWRKEEAARFAAAARLSALAVAGRVQRQGSERAEPGAAWNSLGASAI